MDNIIFAQYIAQYTKNKHIIMGLPYDVLVAKTRDLVCRLSLSKCEMGLCGSFCVEQLRDKEKEAK